MPPQVGEHVGELAASMGEHAKLQPAGGGAAAARQVFRGLMRNRELRDIAAQQVGALPCRAGLSLSLSLASASAPCCARHCPGRRRAARSPCPAAARSAPPQAEQLEALRSEVARLKARSFPSFEGVDPKMGGLAKRTAPPADLKPSLAKARARPGQL
jgi:hypothetical protein